MLTVTSYANRTAPVLRGAWILENLMGTPPAAPPPDVEGFPENKDGEKPRIGPRDHGAAPREAVLRLRATASWTRSALRSRTSTQ